MENALHQMLLEKMQIKKTMKYHSIPIRTAEIQNTENTKY